MEKGVMIGYTVEALIDAKHKGVLGVEFAGGYWGLNSYTSNMPIYVVTDSSLTSVEYYDGVISLLVAPKLVSDNIVEIADGIYVTNRERTVCDMLLTGRHEFHLYETVIRAYEYGDTNVELMESLASEYGVLDKLHEVYKLALEAEEEDALA